jgi:hypothetical protein
VTVQPAADAGFLAELDGTLPRVAPGDTVGIREVVHQTQHHAVAAAVVQKPRIIEGPAGGLHEVTPDLLEKGDAHLQQLYARDAGPMFLDVDRRHDRQCRGEVGIPCVRHPQHDEGELVETQAA